MEKSDLRYLAKIVRRYCKDSKYTNAVITPDYETGHIDITGLPFPVRALNVCKVIEDKGVKVIGKGDTKVLIKF
jgi:hypothetical protein